LYEEIGALIEEGKSVGLPTVIWSYPRGSGLAKEGEQAVDITGYAAQIACQLGAGREARHPDQDARRPHPPRRAVMLRRQAHRHFSGGEAKDTPAILAEVKEIAAGGGFGSITGRNSFQRPRDEALKVLTDVMNVFKTA
jgi:class I fructose-bisphosphate aldolase